MNIVITDGYTLNPGDLSWDNITALGQVNLHDRTPIDQLVQRCKDADIVVTNKTPFSADALQALPNLKMIAVTATGYNIIDIKTAAKQHIVVSNVPAYGTASVAQHAIALLLELTNHVGRNARATAEGKWVSAADWCFTEGPVMELEDKTIGIVGYGNIGQRTARIAQALGMKIIYHSPSPKPGAPGESVSIDVLFADSDAISLHCPLTADNQEFVNKSLLKKMKPSALLINTARGQLIQEQDLADALNEGRLAGAALDVLSKEPPPASNPLLTAKNCIITPHNAWISKEARTRIMDTTIKNIKAFIDGKPIHNIY